MYTHINIYTYTLKWSPLMYLTQRIWIASDSRMDAYRGLSPCSTSFPCLMSFELINCCAAPVTRQHAWERHSRPPDTHPHVWHVWQRGGWDRWQFETQPPMRGCRQVSLVACTYLEASKISFFTGLIIVSLHFSFSSGIQKTDGNLDDGAKCDRL